MKAARNPLVLLFEVESLFFNGTDPGSKTRAFEKKIGILHYLLTRTVFVIGEVKVSYLKRPYFVTVTTYQMAVILLFNEKTSLHFW